MPTYLYLFIFVALM